MVNPSAHLPRRRYRLRHLSPLRRSQQQLRLLQQPETKKKKEERTKHQQRRRVRRRYQRIYCRRMLYGRVAMRTILSRVAPPPRPLPRPATIPLEPMGPVSWESTRTNSLRYARHRCTSVHASNAKRRPRPRRSYPIKRCSPSSTRAVLRTRGRCSRPAHLRLWISSTCAARQRTRR